MNDDATLLRSYAEQGSEAAFSELVRRHIDLVYGAALRRMGGDTHRAADVAQQVFTNLARDARKLSRHAVLGAWLHTATRNAALNLMISDQRRQAREAEALAFEQATAPNEPEVEWTRLRPLLDAAIDELPEADRAAVVLRYLERREFADIGSRLGLSADAARMRADRALEKLRATLARRGVKSTSAALAAVFANQVAATAPAGLATSITGAALASAAAGAGFFMSTTTAIIATVAVAALGSTAYEWNRAFRAESQLAALTADRDVLRTQFRTTQQQAARSTQDVTALRSELDAVKAKQAAMLAAPRTAPTPAPAAEAVVVKTSDEMRRSSTKAIMNNLRQLSAARAEFQRRNGRPAASLDELVGENKLIRALVPVNGESYATLSLVPGTPMTVAMTEGGLVTYDPSAPSTPPPAGPLAERIKELGQKLNVPGRAATDAYRAAHNGAPPPSLDALIPYFANPQDGADFVELLEAIKQAQAASAPGK